MYKRRLLLLLALVFFINAFFSFRLYRVAPNSPDVDEQTQASDQYWMPLVVGESQAPRAEAPVKRCETNEKPSLPSAFSSAMGSALRASSTDANGNPVIGETYLHSVHMAFALGDLPI